MVSTMIRKIQKDVVLICGMIYPQHRIALGTVDAGRFSSTAQLKGLHVSLSFNVNNVGSQVKKTWQWLRLGTAMLMPPPKRLTAIDAPTTQKKSGGFIGNRQSTLAALTFDQSFLDLIVQSEPFMALAITLATLCYRL